MNTHKNASSLTAVIAPTFNKQRLRILAASLLLFLVLAQATTVWARPNFADLVKHVAPAVVAIKVSETRAMPTSNNPLDQIDPRELPDFLRRFFEQMPNNPGAPERHTEGQGSGFIIAADGYVLTNAHVVKDADDIRVSLGDRSEYKAKLIGADERTDIALLKIDAKDLPTVELGNSDQLEVGEWVLAIGSPFGFEHTATQGIISALSRSLPDENYVPFIQTDAAVNPGNSGGPLFNEDGEVIGINSQIYSRSGGYMGLSFAIPINVAIETSNQLKAKGYASRGWLGVSIQDMDQALAESFGLDKPKGALVADVSTDSPAAKAGMQNGDVIISYNGKIISRSADLPPLVGTSAVGEQASVEVLRAGARKVIKVTIGELAREPLAVSANVSHNADSLGMSLEELTADQKRQLNNRGVAVRDVALSGPAADAGIRAGDVILTYNHKDITSVQQLMDQIKRSPKDQPIAVLIQRNNATRFLALTIPKA